MWVWLYNSVTCQRQDGATLSRFYHEFDDEPEVRNILHENETMRFHQTSLGFQCGLARQFEDSETGLLYDQRLEIQRVVSFSYFLFKVDDV